MKNKMFFHTVTEFECVPINVYFYLEHNVWLFDANNISDVFNKINQGCTSRDSGCFILEMKEIKKINILQHDKWQTVEVMTKDDILTSIKNNDSCEIKKFERWITKICSDTPKECFLPNNSREYEFLNLATNRFLDLFGEINNVTFMNLSPELRLYKIKDFFSIYAELLLYEPIKDHVKFVEKSRPSMEAVMCKDLVKFIRNVMTHFPFFTTWDEIYITKSLINWVNEGQSIDRFLNKYQGHESVLYRFKEKNGQWRYPEINFPKSYSNDKIYLKDMVNERDGMLLCAILMFEVVSSQIIEVNE